MTEPIAYDGQGLPLYALRRIIVRTIPRDEVDATVRAAMDSFPVVELACDPPGWHAGIGRWRDTYGEVVLDFPTASQKRMSDACSKFWSATMGGRLGHDDDKRLARHLGNAIVKETAEGGYITKDHPASPRKIDAAIAAVVAHDRARWHAENPDREPLLAFA